MALSYLAFPTKSTSEVDLIKPLRNFIKATFPDTSPDDYEKALTEFHRMRSHAVGKFNDKHESAIEAVGKYYDQLAAVESKLPFTEDQVRVSFTWYDAFAKSSIIGGRPKLSIALGAFEKVCLLFNIAALQSQVASVQSRETDDGLKLSAKLFQQSSGILKYLKDNVMSLLGRDPTQDLHPDTLAAISALMVAQAQESIYLKCVQDKKKDGIIAKIAMQLSCYYSEALKLLQLYSVANVWPKEWVVTVAGKQAAFHGMAEFYQSGAASAKLAYGEEIARLQHSKELVQSAMTRAGREVDFSRHLAKIESALQKVKKDNDLIYHDKVPPYRDLPLIEKAVVGKPLPVPTSFTSSPDLFVKLVPLAVHVALSGFETRKNQLINTEVGRIREATHTLNGILASLNLPAAIEDVGGKEVPASVKEKAEKVQGLGGLSALNNLISELPELLNRNKEILEESFRMLDEEAASDLQLKEQFGEKWNRTPSDKLTGSIRADGEKYRSIINNAVQADTVVKEKYSGNKRGFELLSAPIDQLQSSLPSGSAVGSLNDSAAVKQLRSLMADIQTLKSDREAIETELKAPTSDMMSKFVAAMAADGIIDEESISAAELQTIYGSLTERVNESLSKQESMIGQVQSAHQAFSQEKMLDRSGAQRAEMLKELATAFDAFVELKSNLEEGTKFYNDLTQILVKFQNKISDLCFARKTEKDELMKDLSQQIASRPGETAPSAPNYQKGKAAPSRPPPPAPKSSTPVANPQAPPQPAVTASQPAVTASQPAVPSTQATASPRIAAPPQAAVQQMPTGNFQQSPTAYPQQQAPGHNPTPYPAYPYYAPPVPTGFNPYAFYQNPSAPYSPVPGQPPYPPHPNVPYPQPPQGYPYPNQGYPGYPPQ
ncbi:programmed cell death 6-interacting protein-like [Watersipora subatra]|uniref:programmed cell death 6-interacting protein-like n=1 Tax=Watersipora subatra TaxID=2589382 RepID=UPI00355C9507